jgi:hypothetical protein
MVGMSLCQCLEPRMELLQLQCLPFDTSGEIELLSLHRIRSGLAGRLPPMDVHPQIQRKLINELLRENKLYQEEHRCKRFCITPISLDVAVNHTQDYLKGIMNQGLATLDDESRREAFRRVMTQQVNAKTDTMKTWFYDNYDSLIYNTNSKIPYPIVIKMREQLGKWALEHTNPFHQPIGILIEDTIKGIGLNPKDYDSREEMWQVLKDYRS